MVRDRQSGFLQHERFAHVVLGHCGGDVDYFLRVQSMQRGSVFLNPMSISTVDIQLGECSAIH